MADRSTTAVRDPATGQWAFGNPGGPGTAYAGTLQRFRSAIHKATPPERLARIWEALLDEAESGNVLAAKEVLDRIFGKQAQVILMGGDGTGPLTLALLDAIRARIEARDVEADVSAPSENGHSNGKQ